MTVIKLEVTMQYMVSLNDEDLNLYGNPRIEAASYQWVDKQLENRTFDEYRQSEKLINVEVVPNIEPFMVKVFKFLWTKPYNTCTIKEIKKLFSIDNTPLLVQINAGYLNLAEDFSKIMLSDKGYKWLQINGGDYED